MNIPLLIPDITANDIEAVTKVLNSGQLVQGKNVELFENRISTYTAANSSIAVSNGTATMHCALVALGIKEGDEVIVPALSYVATANVVELVGATPIFVDIDINTFNIDVNQIEKAITSKTKAIIPVHEFGLACDIEKVMQIAKKHNLKVVEDAACALGATFNGKHVGLFGDAGSFSFHPRKAITSGEGGMVTTNNAELAEDIRVLRNHGYSSEKNDFIKAGFNYRMTEFQAAFVNNQLDRLNNQIEQRRSLAKVYDENLTSAIITPSEPESCFHTYQTYHVLFDKKIDRDAIQKKLAEKGIGSNYGAQCIPEMAFYKTKYNLDAIKLFPNAHYAFKSGLALPLYGSLNEEKIKYITTTINGLIS
jgi:dTDP-4-amino-4,6-dideoxygalactose transaminase